MPAIAWDEQRWRWRALLCNPQPGSFKTRKQLITAVSPSLHPQTSRWATEIHWNPGDSSVSTVSAAVWLRRCSGKLRMVTTFKLKAPQNPVLNSNGVQCKALILKTNFLSLFTAQLRASRHVTCLCLPRWRLLEKEEYDNSLLERKGRTLPPLPWSKCAAYLDLKRASN